MARWTYSVAALAAVLAFGSSVSIGCAMSDRPELLPTPDPSLPGIDAGGEPSPVAGGGAQSDSGGHESGDAAKDAATLTSPDTGPTVPKPAQGEVLITEVMYNPSGPEPKSEWFEVRNVATAPRDLGGLTIADGAGRTHVIAANTVVAPGAYVLFVRDRATALAQKVPSAAIDYEYGTGMADTAGIVLLNGSTGAVSIHDGSTTIAQAPYGGWFAQPGGLSVQLKVLDYAKSASQSSWCLSPSAWTTGADRGTPGAASDCP